MKKEPVKVDEWNKIPIYFDANSSQFTAAIAGVKFTESDIEVLKRKLSRSDIVEINVEAILWQSIGDPIKVKILRLAEWNKKVAIVEKSNGYEQNYELNELYPINPKNNEVFTKAHQMRDKGWELIHTADRMFHELDTFTKDFFKPENIVKRVSNVN